MYNESDYSITFLNDLYSTKIDDAVFCKEISLFSRYISKMNPNYKYNETYLSTFCDDFCKFRKYVASKRDAYIEISDIVINANCNLTIELDHFWKIINYYSTDKTSYYKYSVMNCDMETLCSDYVYIKGTIINSNRKLIFDKQFTILKNMKINRTILKKIIKQLHEFIDNK